jgi:hypothetical protein
MPESKLRLWFALFVLVVFCLGLAGGILIGRRLPLAEEGRRGGAPLRGLLIDRLSRDLDLTADQRATIDRALASSRIRLDALQKDVRKRFDAERRAVREAIRGVLTPEQQQKFDRIEREGRSRGGRRGR